MAPPRSWRPEHPLIGRLLANRYQVASFIREGGMAQVFCGIQDEAPQHVAIKVVHPELAEDPEVVARFLREAEVAARLVHPNIVRIVEVGEDGDLLYMVMELLFGEDLSAPIKQRGSFSEARAAQIILQVCAALDHAHQRGVIHRDVKPENIMICRQPDDPLREVVKVLDFGIAKVLDTKHDVALPTEAPTSVRSVLTRVGTLVGTPAYVSPEQGRAEPFDHRADIYSTGVVLYELVCGRPPFEGQTPLQIVAKHVHEQPPPPSSHCAVHPGLESLILRTLSKQPADRPQSARALAAELERLLPQLSAAPIERWIQPPSSPQVEWSAALSPTVGVPSRPAVPPVADAFDDARTKKIDLPPASVPSVSSPRRHHVDYRPDHPFLGRVLNNRFQLVAFMREGGMGQVFSGTQQQSPRNVAIKIIHPELAKEGEVVSRFLREAKLAARLHHRNIVRILAVGQDADLLYLVMELLFGDDLFAPIKQRGSFTEARAAKILIEVCEALQHAHDQGVVHRDIKPENVMLCRQPEAPFEEVVKVLDFGIAKVLDASPTAALPLDAPTGLRSALTRVGQLVGTPGYMSPEQGTAQPIDHRSDIYSAGVLLYEMVAGRPPFEGETPLQIVARHVQETPRPPSAHAPVHPRLESLILHMLAKNPAARPATARAVADELRRLLPELSAVAGVAGAPVDRWLNRTQRKPALDVMPAQQERMNRATLRSESHPPGPATPAAVNRQPSAPPVSSQPTRQSAPPPSTPQPAAAPAPAPAPDVAALRAMKQTLPLKGKPLLPAAVSDALRTLPIDGPQRAPTNGGQANAADGRSAPPAVPAHVPDRRLQAKVDSLARTQRVLMILVVVAFSVIAALVVALLLKERR
ncbi:MAG: serine/threonine protein kinase [Myxococcales bacterium]|nr:serine/threonine protein kinase [Myxococcales bacterium]